MPELERTKYLRDFRRKMVAHFDLDELETLAFDLSVDWGELPGEKKSSKSQSLITHLAQRGRLKDLVALLQEERPELEWPEIPSSVQQIEDEKTIVSNTERQKALQEYLTSMNQHVMSKRKKTGQYDSSIIAIAKAFTYSVLPQLDAPQFAIMVRFLSESNIGMKHFDFKNINLSGVNLSGLDLSLAYFSNANLHKADLSEANLHLADLSEADLSEANLSKANLSQALLSRANLHEAHLNEANLSKVRGAGINLAMSKLTYAKLVGASLSFSDFQGADLSNADLSEVQIFGANLSEVNLYGTVLRGTKLSSLDPKLNVNLKGAEFYNSTVWPKNFDPIEAGAINRS